MEPTVKDVNLSTQGIDFSKIPDRQDNKVLSGLEKLKSWVKKPAYQMAKDVADVAYGVIAPNMASKEQPTQADMLMDVANLATNGMVDLGQRAVEGNLQPSDAMFMFGPLKGLSYAGQRKLLENVIEDNFDMLTKEQRAKAIDDIWNLPEAERDAQIASLVNNDVRIGVSNDGSYQLGKDIFIDPSTYHDGVINHENGHLIGELTGAGGIDRAVLEGFGKHISNSKLVKDALANAKTKTGDVTAVSANKGLTSGIRDLQNRHGGSEIESLNDYMQNSSSRTGMGIDAKVSLGHRPLYATSKRALYTSKLNESPLVLKDTPENLGREAPQSLEGWAESYPNMSTPSKGRQYAQEFPEALNAQRNIEMQYKRKLEEGINPDAKDYMLIPEDPQWVETRPQSKVFNDAKVDRLVAEQLAKDPKARQSFARSVGGLFGDGVMEGFESAPKDMFGGLTAKDVYMSTERRKIPLPIINNNPLNRSKAKKQFTPASNQQILTDAKKQGIPLRDAYEYNDPMFIDGESGTPDWNEWLKERNDNKTQGQRMSEVISKMKKIPTK